MFHPRVLPPFNDEDDAIVLIDITLTTSGGFGYNHPVQYSLMLHKCGSEVPDGYFKEYVRMGIPVIFTDGKVGNIQGNTLDRLIQKKEVVAFRRAKGWVQIGRDLIRRAQQPLKRLGNRRDDFPLNLAKP